MTSQPGPEQQASPCPYTARFDHQDPAYAQDPFPVLEQVFSEGPIGWSKEHGGFWVVTGYEEAHWIWSNWESFGTWPSVSIPAGLGSDRPLLPVESDPPEHRRYRGPLNAVFSPRRMRELEPGIRQAAVSLIEGFAARGECDFIPEFAHILPTEVFARMLGVPAEEAQQWRRWNFEILHSHHDDPSGARREAAGNVARARLGALLQERRRRRAQDILSVLVDAEADGGPLTDEEIIDLGYGLFLAGLDTVQAALGMQFWYLATHPDQQRELARDRTRIPRAVEEMLRWDALTSVARTVRKDTEYRGVLFRTGDRVLVSSRAANRDPRVWDSPEVADFGRAVKPTLVFASGPHRCVGSHLAREELRIVHEEMAQRIPAYQLREGAQLQFHTGTVGGLSSLPLVWVS
jgi:cytochrome P450